MRRHVPGDGVRALVLGAIAVVGVISAAFSHAWLWVGIDVTFYTILWTIAHFIVKRRTRQ